MEVSEFNERTRAVQCKAHGEYQAKVIDLMGREIVTGCPECARERREQEEQAAAAIKDEAKRQRHEARLVAAGVTKRFHDCTLEGYAAEHDGQRRALNACCALADAVAAGEGRIGSVVLCGKPGTGKTHLAVGVVLRVLQAKRTVLKINVSDMIRRVRETWGSRDVSELQVYDMFANLDLLVIDELGVQSGSDNEKQILFEVLNRRYEACLPVLVISNLSPDGVKAELGDRVTDRLREDGGRIITCEWDSWRKNPRA